MDLLTAATKFTESALKVLHSFVFIYSTEERFPIFIGADHYGTSRSNFCQSWNNAYRKDKLQLFKN